jgi:outer membrane protein OmpA-like peptidoglycan-associated protein
MGSFAVTPLIQLQHLSLPVDAEGQRNDGDVMGIFAAGGGARISLLDEHKEVFFQATASYYTAYNGPMENEDGEGYAIMGGFNYDFSFLPKGMGLGLFIRRDEADIDAAADRDDALQYLVIGASVRHRFLPPPPAPPPPPAVAEAPPPAPAVTKKLILRGVNFDFDKATLRPDAIPILDEAARTLKTESSLLVSVEGHTDSRGTDEYNQALSVRRATTVRNYLSEHGVDAGRLTVVGHGESRPVASNDTDDGRAQNRRVELLVK